MCVRSRARQGVVSVCGEIADIGVLGCVDDSIRDVRCVPALENGNLISGWIEGQAGMEVGSTCSDSAYIKYTYTCGVLYPFIAFDDDDDLCEDYTEACCDNH